MILKIYHLHLLIIIIGCLFGDYAHGARPSNPRNFPVDFIEGSKTTVQSCWSCESYENNPSTWACATNPRSTTRQKCSGDHTGCETTVQITKMGRILKRGCGSKPEGEAMISCKSYNYPQSGFNLCTCDHRDDCNSCVNKANKWSVDDRCCHDDNFCLPKSTAPPLPHCPPAPENPVTLPPPATNCPSKCPTYKPCGSLPTNCPPIESPPPCKNESQSDHCPTTCPSCPIGPPSSSSSRPPWWWWPPSIGWWPRPCQRPPIQKLSSTSSCCIPRFLTTPLGLSLNDGKGAVTHFGSLKGCCCGLPGGPNINCKIFGTTPPSRVDVSHPNFWPSHFPNGPVSSSPGCPWPWSQGVGCYPPPYWPPWGPSWPSSPGQDGRPTSGPPPSPPSGGPNPDSGGVPV